MPKPKGMNICCTPITFVRNQLSRFSLSGCRKLIRELSKSHKIHGIDLQDPHGQVASVSLEVHNTRWGLRIYAVAGGRDPVDLSKTLKRKKLLNYPVVVYACKSFLKN